jgi:hypothetical protein
MGNDSINLVFDPHLTGYRGAILSPVNCDKAETAKHIGRLRSLPGFEILLDPQLYYPKSEMGRLPGWDYFPRDVDTADLSSLGWWRGVVDRLIDSMTVLGPDAICSPAMVPQAFPDGYFDHLVEVSDYLTDKLMGSGIESIATLIVKLSDISQPGRAMSIASIMSRAKCTRIFVVFVGETEPRRELNSPEALMGAMTLIRTLEQAEMPAIVGFCSTDVLLWKHAGASSCATGKFFNLRRFTFKRFAEPSAGGGQLAYWLEESLLAFLRQSDLIRVQQRGLVSAASLANPFGAEIINKFSANEPWVGLSWRQFMWWFCNVEARLTKGEVTSRDLVNVADASWAALENPPKVFFEERTNDGSWIRQWLRALEELDYFA